MVSGKSFVAEGAVVVDEVDAGVLGDVDELDRRQRLGLDGGRPDGRRGLGDARAWPFRACSRRARTAESSSSRFHVTSA